MMLCSTQLRFAAVALAMATVSLAGGSAAQAFTFQTLETPSNGTKFADPEDQVKNLSNGSAFGSNGPTVQFGAQQNPFLRPYGGPRMMAPQSLGNSNNND